MPELVQFLASYSNTHTLPYPDPYDFRVEKYKEYTSKYTQINIPLFSLLK